MSETGASTSTTKHLQLVKWSPTYNRVSKVHIAEKKHRTLCNREIPRYWKTEDLCNSIDAVTCGNCRKIHYRALRRAR